jgi:hypothetical protein
MPYVPYTSTIKDLVVAGFIIISFFIPILFVVVANLNFSLVRRIFKYIDFALIHCILTKYQIILRQKLWEIRLKIHNFLYMNNIYIIVGIFFLYLSLYIFYVMFIAEPVWAMTHDAYDPKPNYRPEIVIVQDKPSHIVNYRLEPTTDQFINRTAPARGTIPVLAVFPDADTTVAGPINASAYLPATAPVPDAGNAPASVPRILGLADRRYPRALVSREIFTFPQPDIVESTGPSRPTIKNKLDWMAKNNLKK